MIRLPVDVEKDLQTTLFRRPKDQHVTVTKPGDVVPPAPAAEPPISLIPSDAEERDGPLGNSLRDWLLS